MPLYYSPSILTPTNIEGSVYIDTANTQGWAGTDVGGWINSAYAFLQTTYGTSFGGIIQIAPGQYNFSTPIVCALTGFSIIIRGSGDGNGGTVLNYTPATATTAMTLGGGSGNNGGVSIEDFTLTGSAMGNGATAISWGDAGVAGTAGATCKNVAILRFSVGMTWVTGGTAYAVELFNTKIQTCTTGMVPTQENNLMVGGLIGGCGTGVSCTTAVEFQMFGVAFDDQTVTAINIANINARITMDGCRFENPSLTTTASYITISAGTIVMIGGGMQDDNSTGSQTGFIQATGGIVTMYGTWCASQGRTVAQIANLSGTVYANLNPVIAPASTGIVNTFTPSYGNAITVAPSLIKNQNAALQSQLTVAGTDFLIAGSALAIPTAFTGGSGIRVGTTYTWNFNMTKTAAGTATFPIKIRLGTTGTLTDATLANVFLAVPTAVADFMNCTVQMTFTAVGASGSMYWSCAPQNKAATGTGFGPASTTVYSGTVASINTTTSGLIATLSFQSGTGVPTITVPQINSAITNLG